MKTLLFVISITLGLSIGISSSAFAVCEQTGNTPGGGNIIDCPGPVQNNPVNMGTNPGTTNLADQVTIPEGGGIDTAEGTAIDPEDGDDTVTINGGICVGSSQCIGDPGGNDIITVNGGFLEGGSQAIQMNGPGNRVITINGGTLSAPFEPIEGGQGNDTLTINGGIIDVGSGSVAYIDMNQGNDVVNLNGGSYLFELPVLNAITLGSENDILTFGADIDLRGEVDCGSGFDTLVFAMDVPIEFEPIITNQILATNPSADSIVINDINYEWENCEQLLADLNGVQNIRPIPTLSQWGLIAMAGLIGFVGLLVMRRRAAA